jgi:hypothetical protein
MSDFSVFFIEKIMFKSRKIKLDHSPKEKRSRYLWGTNFEPDYSATLFSQQKCALTPLSILCVLYFYGLDLKLPVLTSFSSV